MIQHVYEQALASDAKKVVVATDDERIVSAVKEFGGNVQMTAPDHPSGTDRLHEAAMAENLDNDDIVVNVQGDEPLIPPEVINQVANNLIVNKVSMATLSEPIDSLDDLFDPNIVKVVTDDRQVAVYFSRAPIPWRRDEFAQEPRVLEADGLHQRHMGIYAYRLSLLKKYVSWQPSPLEQAEKLEQLRALWHGVEIHVAPSIKSIPPGIDTEKDLHRTLDLLENS